MSKSQKKEIQKKVKKEIKEKREKFVCRFCQIKGEENFYNKSPYICKKCDNFRKKLDKQDLKGLKRLCLETYAKALNLERNISIQFDTFVLNENKKIKELQKEYDILFRKYDTCKKSLAEMFLEMRSLNKQIETLLKGKHFDKP